MSKKGIITLIVGICLVCFTAPEIADITLKVGTGPVGGNWFPLGAVVSTLINEKVEGVRAAPTLGGGKSNLIALNKGKQDFSRSDLRGREASCQYEKRAWRIYRQLAVLASLWDFSGHASDSNPWRGRYWWSVRDERFSEDGLRPRRRSRSDNDNL